MVAVLSWWLNLLHLVVDTAFVGFALQSGGMHQDTTHVQSVGNHGQDSQKLILHYGEMRTSFILQCSDFYLDSLILYEQSALHSYYKCKK